MKRRDFVKSSALLCALPVLAYGNDKGPLFGAPSHLEKPASSALDHYKYEPVNVYIVPGDKMIIDCKDGAIKVKGIIFEPRPGSDGSVQCRTLQDEKALERKQLLQWVENQGARIKELESELEQLRSFKEVVLKNVKL